MKQEELDAFANDIREETTKATLSVFSDDVSEDQRDVSTYNVGESNYAELDIQPWEIWRRAPNLNPWEADIIKRILRSKPGQRILDLQKIKHICDELILQERGHYDTNTK